MSPQDPIGFDAPPFRGEPDRPLADEPRSPMVVRRPRRTLRSRITEACIRVLEAIRAIPGGEPSNWRDVAVFLTGSAWGAMLAVGLLLAVRP